MRFRKDAAAIAAAAFTLGQRIAKLPDAAQKGVLKKVLDQICWGAMGCPM